MRDRSDCPHTALRTALWISQDPDLAGNWGCYTGSDGSIYDEHDRCALGLSNSWQSWWQNRQDTKTGVSCNHLSATPPPHLLPLSATDRGDTGSRVFLWWAAERAAIQSVLIGSAYRIHVHLWCERYNYALIFTHRMCWQWREWLQAAGWGLYKDVTL